jgi:hypothetical protein
MATVVTIGGQEYKQRSPWGAWLLCFTVVYAFIWFFKVNNEAKQYLQDDSSPGLRTLGTIVPLLNLFIYYRLGDSVSRVEEKAGIQKTVEPFLVVIAGLFYFLMVPYVQSHLNKVWDAALAREGSGMGQPMGGQMPPAVPPPPPA